MEECCFSRKNLYMLPTRHGIIFSIVLLAMLLVAVNYNNSLAYIMCFTLFSSVLVSMLYTHRNLAGVCLSYGGCNPVFAGNMLNYKILLSNSAKRDRYDIGIDIEGEQSQRRDFTANETLTIECSTLVKKRGWYTLPAVQVNTRYPLGLLFSWSKPVALERKCLVYPRPSPRHQFPDSVGGESVKPVQSNVSSDDFSGLREFREGDTPQHIDWKTYARGKGLYSKEFLGGEMPEITFKWEQTFGDREGRISLLTRWVIDAGAQGIKFGLKLPGTSIQPSNDELHIAKCLATLALF